MTRSIINIQARTDDDGRLVVEFVCDCASVTDVTIDGPVGPIIQELAYTCDGCGTSHWFTICAPAEEVAGG